MGCDATGYRIRKERCGESFDDASTSARHCHAGRAMIAGRFEGHGRGLGGGGIKNPTCERVKDSSDYHLQGVDGSSCPQWEENNCTLRRPDAPRKTQARCRQHQRTCEESRQSDLRISPRRSQQLNYLKWRRLGGYGVGPNSGEPLGYGLAPSEARAKMSLKNGQNERRQTIIRNVLGRTTMHSLFLSASETLIDSTIAVDPVKELLTKVAALKQKMEQSR